MSVAEIKKTKSDLIAWIEALSDVNLLTVLNGLKDSQSEKDWWDDLSENQKRVIQMSFYEGMSQAAIAERLHQPLGTVKGWARSALSRLRGKLDPHLLDFSARR